jgi:hypothetical protein
MPAGVPTDGCIEKDGYTLLYVGISPDKKGKPNSRANLKHASKPTTAARWVQHLGEHWESYLRQKVHSLCVEWVRNRTTFTHSGEQWLDHWMEQMQKCIGLPGGEQPGYWKKASFSSVALPLNIHRNSTFKSLLSAMRSKAMAEAKLMEIADESGCSRRLIKTGNPL